MTLSIIIPVYNTEAYLPACIDSILSQSFSDFEVLLIDDGSKDGSGSICDAYAAKDSRIRVFHKANGGVSSARNLGLEHAAGEWIYFVDSDDEVLPGGLQTMINSISDDVDIVLAGYERYDENGRVFYRIDERIITLLDKRESLSTLYEAHGKYYEFLTYGWIRLLRNSIIQSHHLRFDIQLKNKEDTLFLVQYVCQSNGVTRFDTTPVYRYNERRDSAMGRWKFGFDHDYLDSLYALVKMKHEIASFFPRYSETFFIAGEGIWIRYNKILYKMNLLGIHDDILLAQMKEIIKKELGLGFFIRKKLRNIWRKYLKRLFIIWLATSFMPAYACSSLDVVSLEPDPLFTEKLDCSIEVFDIPYRDWTSVDRIFVNQYALLSLIHQSTAAYGDYAFFVTKGRSRIIMYSLRRKEQIYILELNSVDDDIFHCNQSSFGNTKYEGSDPFPLLYISQRSRMDNRCFIEVFRILPLFDEELMDYVSFQIELVQTIYLPVMSYQNSLGNANCAIDQRNGWMYTYSRNNNAQDDNYGQCKITQFEIPDIYDKKVVLNDQDIISSFMIEASAVNMQGGCIQDGVLYIGQGTPSSGNVYLNIIDLEKKELVRQIDLREHGFNWEPEGCFFYDGSVMLTHMGAICRIDK